MRGRNLYVDHPMRKISYLRKKWCATIQDRGRIAIFFSLGYFELIQLDLPLLNKVFNSIYTTPTPYYQLIDGYFHIKTTLVFIYSLPRCFLHDLWVPVRDSHRSLYMYCKIRFYENSCFFVTIYVKYVAASSSFFVSIIMFSLT